MISGEKKALVLAHPFFVKASKYPNEAPQRPETCIEQLYKPSRMKKRTKIDTANLVLILDTKNVQTSFFVKKINKNHTSCCLIPIRFDMLTAERVP